MAVMRTPQEHIETLGSSIVDTLTPTDHDGNAVDLKETIDYICSQIADMLGESAWETAPDEDIATLAARAKLEDTLAETEYESLVDVTVPNGQNYKVLALADLPTFKTKAIALTAIGLVTAEHAGTFGTHSLDEVAGDNALAPRNLLQVVDGASGDPILSGGKVVWGLLQHESGATDEADFTATTPERAQVSFVRSNATNNDLEAVPVADIEDAVINLSFVRRKALSSRTPQDWMRRTTFVDLPTGAAAVTLDNAVDNQGATPVTQGTNTEWRIDDDVDLTFETSDGGRTLLGLSPAAAGDTIEMNADSLDINVGAAGTVDIDNGVTVDSGGTSINLGVTAGQIDATAVKLAATTGIAEVEGTTDVVLDAGETLVADAADLDADFTDDSHLIMRASDAALKTLELTAANDGAGDSALVLNSEDGDITFQTENETTPIPLDDGTTGPISGVGSGSHASIAAAIADAYANGGVDLTTKFVTFGSNYAKDANVPAATLDLTAFSMNWAATPTVFLFLQGRIVHGAGAIDTGDAYPGTAPSNGDVKFSYPGGVKSGWKLFSIGLAQ